MATSYCAMRLVRTDCEIQGEINNISRVCKTCDYIVSLGGHVGFSLNHI
jgi:hypothetical protein